MRRLAKLLAVLLLAFGPVALTSVIPARSHAAGDNRGQERKAERQAGRQQQPERRMPERAPGRAQGYAPPVYAAPAYRQPPQAYQGYAPAPAPAPYPAYPPAYAAPAPGGYAYAPPPGYRPNSLGAEWGQQQDQARSAVRQGRMMPLGQVMQQIRRGTPGRLLDAGLERGPDGRPAYRVRWAAAGGQRIDFIVDAVTGAVLAQGGY